VTAFYFEICPPRPPLRYISNKFSDVDLLRRKILISIYKILNRILLEVETWNITVNVLFLQSDELS
jgi:hypothetical protein